MVVPCLVGERRGKAEGDNHINVARHQFCDKTRQPFQSPLRSAALEHDVAALYIAVLCEAADQGHPEWAIIRQRSRGGKEADAMDLGRRLRFSTPRRSEQRAAQDFDELPPPHVSPRRINQ